VEREFGDRVIHWENHQSSSDPFSTTETDARGDWYGVPGYPTVKIDGSREVIGAVTCEDAASNYRGALNERFQETNNTSPVEITGRFEITDSEIVYSATFRKVDPVLLADLRATLLFYEDDITWCCGNGGVDHWDGVTRDIYDQNITLTNVGDEVTLSTTVPRNPNWNVDNLHGVAYLQQTSGSRQIIQGGRLPRPYDFRMACDNYADSVPAGNGTATYAGRITNTGINADLITLTLPTGLGSWTSEIYVCGDANPHTTPVVVDVPSGGACDFSVRVHTDGTKAIRTGAFVAASANTGDQKTSNLKVFNGGYAVYLINDSNLYGGGSGIWTTALDQLGALYEQWDVDNDHLGAAPLPIDVEGFDIMIWETGYKVSALPDAGDVALMMHFVGGGGSLLFTSQNYLSTLNNIPNAFTQGYLGIASWTVDTGYTSLVGVAGDPIGGGLDLPLSFPYPQFNQGDHVVLNTAITGLRGNNGSNAMVHNERSGAKIVFMPACFNAISTSDPDPNNQAGLLGRILTWLEPAPPAGVDDLPSAVVSSRIAAVRPNPFNPRTEILYQVSARGADGPVRLEIFDMAGRRVSGVFEGRTTPGEHAVAWAGQSDLGRPVESGVYFARLTTVEGNQGSKLVLLK
jgi:hypothetical protein